MTISLIKTLPLELHFQIFSHLTAQDIVNFLSTCKAFYSTIRNETIWRNLSSRDFGISDLSVYQDHHDYPEEFTFHAVYSRFLFPYGSLIGLWASDHPFKGNVQGFRLMMEAEYKELGIIGEVWRFPAVLLPQQNMNPAERDRPVLPSYIETVHILFRRDLLDLSTEGTGYTVAIYFPWETPPEGVTPVHRMTGKSSMFWLGKTVQSYYLWYGSAPTESSHCLHPEFPPNTSVVWYDIDRVRPHFPTGTIQPKPYDNMATMSRINNVMYLCGAPSKKGLIKPPALSMSCGPYAPKELHHPVLPGIADLRGDNHAEPLEEAVFGMRDMEQPCGRYYPIRFPDPPPPNSLTPALDTIGDTELGESLAGIWLVGCGLHGTEVLYLEWAEEERTVKAWKITGDVQVPRGTVNWWFKLDSPVTLDDMTCHILGDIQRSTRAYHGRGISSGRGFIPGMQDSRRFTVAIVNEDDIRIWIRRGDVHRGLFCIRYRPRDVQSEAILSKGTRVAAEALSAWRRRE
ncbi:hypothetical protein BXZ70DRAFT_237647 [Cristinia sonorae]|uniref:F-box domain-containing protein n=1 Tax=Cristinia sonorae TaxID=1940300 RepID=A0A8K0XPI9_9AGAR|nr:hypothetical protein BXZ70DRAFT_237647 [Cristinia sonorae]